MAFSPVSGTSGRVRVGSNVTVAGITKWRLESNTAEIPIPHFESGATAGGVVTPDVLRGLGSNRFQIEGIYNTDTTDQTETGTPGLINGAILSADFLYVRGAGSTNAGYHNVVGFITNFSAGTDINNQAATFTATYVVSGPLPAYTVAA